MDIQEVNNNVGFTFNLSENEPDAEFGCSHFEDGTWHIVATNEDEPDCWDDYGTFYDEDCAWEFCTRMLIAMHLTPEAMSVEEAVHWLRSKAEHGDFDLVERND